MCHNLATTQVGLELLGSGDPASGGSGRCVPACPTVMLDLKKKKCSMRILKEKFPAERAVSETVNPGEFEQLKRI